MLRCSVLGLAILAAPLGAQATRQTTGQIVGDIATTPLQDTNIRKRQIPVVLEDATIDPYASESTRNCRQLNMALADLDVALGPDFDAGRATGGTKTGRMAAGLARGVVGGLIPFRGVVREVTGAADAQRRYEAAIDAGIARRGYLRGLAKAKGCKRPVATTMASAEG